MLLEAETNKYCPGGYDFGAISNLITWVLNFFLSAVLSLSRSIFPLELIGVNAKYFVLGYTVLLEKDKESCLTIAVIYLFMLATTKTCPGKGTPTPIFTEI